MILSFDLQLTQSIIVGPPFILEFNVYISKPSSKGLCTTTVFVYSLQLLLRVHLQSFLRTRFVISFYCRCTVPKYISQIFMQIQNKVNKLKIAYNLFFFLHFASFVYDFFFAKGTSKCKCVCTIHRMKAIHTSI